MGYLLLAIAVILNSAANVLFKHAAGMTVWTLEKGGLFLLALALGLGNTLLYIKSLEELELGVAYPILSAASILVIAVLSVAFFKEAVTLQKVAALCTICVGMLMLWKA
jgi:multidrug transporter EmrE-like cation transporter